MKILFLIFHGLYESNGISKKIQYQVDALRSCGQDVRLCSYIIDSDGHRKRMINENVLEDFGTGMSAKVKKKCCYNSVYQYIRKEKIEMVYMRSLHNANPFTIRLFHLLRSLGVKSVMEIPTYPYDQEYITPMMKAELFIDRCFRHQLAAQLDAIVTFSNEVSIFGQRTIRISNGITFNDIPLKTDTHHTNHELHLLGVAEVHYWHGFDRLIKGLAHYYKTPQTYKVYFHIVGELSGIREEAEIKAPIKEYQLEEYVLLHGAKHGSELNDYFNQADFGIGSLGRHRSGITEIKTLKNREYAARGIPFIYSETDSDFDHQPYILKAPADETAIDIQQIITFHQQLRISPQEIRESVSSLSWKCQMQKVITEVTQAPLK